MQSSAMSPKKNLFTTCGATWPTFAWTLHSYKSKLEHLVTEEIQGSAQVFKVSVINQNLSTQ